MIYVQKYTNVKLLSSKLLHFLERNVAFKIKKVNLLEKEFCNAIYIKKTTFHFSNKNVSLYIFDNVF